MELLCTRNSAVGYGGFATKCEMAGSVDVGILELKAQLEVIQAQCAELERARDALKSAGALDSTVDARLQRGFDRLSDRAIALAERAARQHALTLNQIGAKAQFVLELSESHANSPLDRLVHGLVDDVIQYCSTYDDTAATSTVADQNTPAD